MSVSLEETTNSNDVMFIKHMAKMATFEWTEAVISELIDLYQERPCLYKLMIGIERNQLLDHCLQIFGQYVTYTVKPVLAVT